MSATQPKVYVLHENLDWTRHLVTWLERKHIPYELWDLSSGSIDLQSTPPEGIFYNRMSASAHTRGHRFAPEFAQQVIQWLENNHRVVLNGTGAINLEISKVKQYLALNKVGIQTPRTVAVLGKEHLVKAAKKLNIYPLITKHNRAGKGPECTCSTMLKHLTHTSIAIVLKNQLMVSPCYKNIFSLLTGVFVAPNLLAASFYIQYPSTPVKDSNFAQPMNAKCQTFPILNSKSLIH
ncbi:hypothetical protein S100313_02133 (plasmid) [Pediococcus acidilactici]|nr:hypothetical protein S100313_02133 [Pediococcus acidilactici]